MKPTIEDGTEEVRVSKRGSASGGAKREQKCSLSSDRHTRASDRDAANAAPRSKRRGEGRGTTPTDANVEPAAAGRARPRTARAGRATSTRSQAPPKRGLDAQYEGMLCTGKVQFFAALIIPIVVMVVIIAAITATA